MRKVISKRKSLAVTALLLTLTLLLCVVLAIRAGAVQTAVAASDADVCETAVSGAESKAELLSAAPADAAPAANDPAEEEGKAGYSVLYFLFDGVTATSLIGLHTTEGWEMALWMSLVFWIMAVGASIILVLLAKVFSGGEEEGELPYNKMAILGFVFSLFMPIAGVVLSFIGKRREGKTHEGGKIFSIGGLIIGGIFVLITIIVAIVHAASPFLPF